MVAHFQYKSRQNDTIIGSIFNTNSHTFSTNIGGNTTTSTTSRSGFTTMSSAGVGDGVTSSTGTTPGRCSGGR